MLFGFEGRKCAFEIACEENLELEEHLEKTTFLIFLLLRSDLWFTLLKVSKFSNELILIYVVFLES